MHRLHAPLSVRGALALLVVGCSGDQSESSVRRAAGGRTARAAPRCWEEPRILEGGIGPVRVNGSISRLPRSCSVRDTTTGADERAFVVRSGEQEVLAVTGASSTGPIARLELGDPSFRTAGDVGVGSSVAVVRTVHAPVCGVALSDGRLALVAQSLPHVVFVTALQAPADPARRRAMEENPALLPDDARITRILVVAEELPCAGPLVATSALRSTGGEILAETVWTQSLGVRKELVVYLPPSYRARSERRYPVVFLLHGLWGDQWQWVRSGQIGAAMDSLAAAGLPEVIVVMPDGDDGWWTTWNRLVDIRGCRAQPRRRRHTPEGDPSAAEPPESYCVPWARYDDYVARDLVAYVDSRFRTQAGRAHRGIAGLSMGGYGAVALALSYPEVFSAAASHSGVLSLLYAGGDPASPVQADQVETLRNVWPTLWWSMEQPFGDVAGFRARDPGTLAERLVRRGGARRPALYLDVGVDDFLLRHNRAFHHRLTALGYAHVYREHPGGHDHRYWRTHIRESMAWMARALVAAQPP